jgi:hypothetical protein
MADVRQQVSLLLADPLCISIWDDDRGPKGIDSIVREQTNN